MLYEQNITSQNLLEWSTTIDLAERYQIYREHKKDFISVEDDHYSFYNCSWLWFGSFCQYSFEFFDDESFGRFVEYTFRAKTVMLNNPMITCYSHLKCETLLTCLDWRDICDGEMDCLDGTDESDCWALEMNECTTEEFRCHNGQCIPAVFLSDEPMYSDCLDRSDEPINSDFSFTCFENPSFPCEDRSCRPGKYEFSCGDGQCIREMDGICSNGKANFFSNDSCMNAMNCLLKMLDDEDDEDDDDDDDGEEEWCNQLCSDVSCLLDHCPGLFEFPAEPILYGHVRMMFETENVINEAWLPSYICYNEELCKEFLPATIHFNGSACRHINQLDLSAMSNGENLELLIQHLKRIFRVCGVIPTGTYDCNHSNAYQCRNSTKCISKYRLVDGIIDCPFEDDENYNKSCELSDYRFRFRCFDDEKRCFAHSIVTNGYEDCHGGEDEEIDTPVNKQRHIYFPTICDGYEQLIPVIIDGRNETDETECEYWPCDSIYHRCDGVWHCYNGADELDCQGSVCLSFEHMCVLPNAPNKVECLPINRTGDGVIDCLGASDERQYCRMISSKNKNQRFFCWNDTRCISSDDLCDGYNDCKFDDDEQFCMNKILLFGTKFCNEPSTDVGNVLCHLSDSLDKKVYLTLLNMESYPLSLTINNNIEGFSLDIPNPSIKNMLDTDIEDEWTSRCNRGLNIRVRMNDNENVLQQCLCPPSYYGDTCQYQNERISITFQFRVGSDWRTIFSILILLIDHEGKVHSHDRVEYCPYRDCETKFHVNLLYSTRPKNNAKNYSVRIDVFDKLTLNYRASWVFPILFPFLPVYPLAVQLNIPISSVQPTEHCPLPCIHGQCIKYTNTEKMFFCRCDHGWSGSDCSITHRCNCSSDSLCVDQSICLCPIGKFGSLCYLKQISCEKNTCLNNGLCIPNDPRQEIAENLRYSHSCICSENYYGPQCEYRATRIYISFADNFVIPDSLFVHFIESYKYFSHVRSTIMKKISLHQTGFTIYVSNTFNAAFAQFDEKYYLIVLQESHIFEADISTQIIPSHQCLSIQEIFNKTIVNRHLLRRIKYYHIPCQERNELICFYDEVHLCLCDRSRHANCFEFDFNITHDCQGSNPCKNGGQCFQDRLKCPASIICVCDTCFYGSRCQFSTKSFRPSLDAILGYQIRPNLPLNQQSTAVKVSVAITIIIFVLGFVNGLLLLITFGKKRTRNIGCDLYLFISSIVSMVIMNAFLLKTCFLIATQMNLITNRSFILLQCRSIDFIIRIFLDTSDWLNACIACERIMIVSKGVAFDKRKSTKIAKWIIILVLLIVICTNIQEPLYRQLIDDEEEQRIWCIIKLSPSNQIFDSIINLLHFLIPFFINIISALAIIIITARRRSNIHKKQTYQQHFNEQLQNHKHLLISPSILVLLASPRLIISFLSECMKSVRDPWLFLSGYFISFTSSIMTFPVFVLPSQNYKEQFIQSVKSLYCR
ncbi:unnamed protein product [Adineta steineri]|uniref:Uncharacterized protein n=1 Tax=Adineta steineri TaxID=433720 RepID=A0A814SHY1_9BILA|nr:unnamed protein product [Adineta steineri]CAF1306559.1 unnamed protein product [Adineta steineri]